jgi:hypothetical protein
MKFRKLTHILTVLAFSTLMHATQAYADIITMDALLIEDDVYYTTFQRFDDNLGTLIDVTYFYEGILTAQGFNNGDDVVASDWEGGIDIQVKTYTNEFQYVKDKFINFDSFDIDESSFKVSLGFEAGGNMLAGYPMSEDLKIYSIITLPSILALSGININCQEPGNFDFFDCLSTDTLLNLRVTYIYDDGDLFSVSGPSTLAIFALGLMGIMSRRFKKQS